jgi:Protein of unknown function (DUF4058)
LPLLDHFHAPLHPQRHWESFHTNWAGAIADALNELLPEGYFAEEHTQRGNSGGSTSTLPVEVWSPVAANFVLPAAFPDTFEVRVYQSEGGATLVAAVELVSPANKDRAANMRNFAVKCASYLAQGISLIVIDIVTSRGGNLHNEMMELLNHDKKTFLADDELYAVAYRPIVRDEHEQIDVWTEQLSLGKPLPTLPLALNAETCLPIDLEETYTAACLRRRLG